MRRNPVTRLLALALVLMMTLSLPALAEGCALCGKETSSDTYLCTGCLLELLAEKDVSGGLEITGAALGNDGSVLVSWSDSADNGPYTVYYELLDRASTSFGWTAARNVQGNGVILRQLVPGVSYVFIVEDASGNRAEYVYYAPAVETGNEIGAKIRIHTKVRNQRNVLELPFSASEIM